MSRRPRRSGVRALVTAVLLLVTTLGMAGPARAHSSLESIDPADGSQVATVPARLSLTFDQPVIGLGTALQVTGPAGEEAQGAAKVVDRTVTQAIEPGAPAGAYTVLWRVTSADGHPVSGRFTFTAAAAGAGTPAGDGTRSSPASADSGGSPLLIWVLLVLGVLVVAAGVALALRRPGPSADEEEELHHVE